MSINIAKIVKVYLGIFLLFKNILSNENDLRCHYKL